MWIVYNVSVKKSHYEKINFFEKDEDGIYNIKKKKIRRNEAKQKKPTKYKAPN